MKCKYLILGGGPAGLTFANYLKENNATDFIVVEECDEAGGLCKSALVDGAQLDMGGGHFLDAENHDACNFLFKFMPKEEWNEFKRDSQIYLNGSFIGHPIESNIWQLPVEEQLKYLKSVAVAGCNLDVKMPDKFIDWIYWKLGTKIADDYMIPYNKKMFDDDLNQLGTYWLEKLPNVSFDDILLSCINKKPYGKEPGHTIFYYPKKYGYGELWLRMSYEIKNNIIFNNKVDILDINEKYIVTDKNEKIYADYIISTIPWTSIDNIQGVDDSLKNSIKRLKHTSVVIQYFSSQLDSNAHWIYYPSEEYSYHRILLRKNFLINSNGHWTETNLTRFNDSANQPYYINEYAYPLNTIDKPKIMDELLSYCIKRNVFGLGRWGEHQHYNSDKVVILAINLANKLLNQYE